MITPHKQTIGNIRTKRQTKKRKILSKQRQITRKRFSKRRNAVSESEVSDLDALYKLKETVYKNYPVYDQLYFSDSEATSHSSKQGKRRMKRRIKKFIQKMSISPNDESPDEDSVFSFIIISLTDDNFVIT